MWCKPFIRAWVVVLFLVVASSAVRAQQAGDMPAAAQSSAAEQPAAAPAKIYELRIYVTNPGKLPDLNARFRDHTMKLFEKHGMENIVYWTLAEDFRNEAKDNTLVYIIAHKSKEAADASWASFREDPEWQAVVAKSEENGRLLAGAPVSVYMNPTDFHPSDGEANASSDKPARLFELRIYNDGEARVPSTVGRFRDWEAELFRDSGIETLGFWTKADNSAFVYLLGHPDRETADRNWQTFFVGFRGRRGNPNPNPAPNPDPQVREEGTTTPAAAQDSEQPAQVDDAPPQRRGRRGGRGGPRGGGGNEIRWLVPTDYSPRK
jgi:hypothetical protein